MKKAVYFGLFIIFLWLCFYSQGFSGMKRRPLDPALANQPVYWYERGVKKKAWMALDEIVVFFASEKMSENEQEAVMRQLPGGAKIVERGDFMIRIKVPEPMKRDQILKSLSSVKRSDSVKRTSPVFYAGRDRLPGTRLVLTGQIIVQFSPGIGEQEIARIEAEYGLEQVKSLPFAPKTFLYQTDDPLRSLEAARALYESGLVNYAYPNWIRKRSKRAEPDDPFFLDQWHLNNTGQSGGTAGEDVDIVPVWDTYRGSANEVIAVVDDGLEMTHEDLKANVDRVTPDVNWDFASSPLGDPDPSPVFDDDYHGTAVAGVAAGVGFNGLGITGAAPAAGLVGLRLLGSYQNDVTEGEALTHGGDIIDIYSNSWGPPDGGTTLDGPGPATEDALKYGVTNGRGGLGSIYVWAAGNGGASDNSNYDGYANSRFVIAVSASTNTGQEPSSYAEEGANVRLNAPSGGGTLGITTTDLTGAEGPDPGNYRHDFGGTSAAAPLVSGIIALMLQANPNLTWRDVQHILMTTAEKNDPFDPEWTTNGAGFHVNYKFGFGRINAQAAVSAAHGKLGSDGYAGPAAGPATGSSSPALSIPDNNQTGVSDTITIPGSDNFFVEFVEVYFTATHDRWPDLEITLTSPQGTKSVLARSHSPRSWSGDYTNWRFGSVRHFGELSAGDWTLTVKDLRSDITGVFNSWSLKIYGFSRRLPWVGLVYPANNAAGVPLNTVVTAVFSKDMNPLSLKDTFHLRRGGVDDVPGLVVYDQATKKATFTPAAALDNGSIYTAVIDSSAQDQDGQTLSAAYAWTFTTGGGGGGCFIRTLK